MYKINCEIINSTAKFIINPNSGTKKQRNLVAQYCRDNNCELIETRCRGDAADIAHSICKADPYAVLVAVGGDGLISETANGIMRAGTGRPSSLSGVPLGDGNDFVRAMSEHDIAEPQLIDIMSVNGVYSLNMINIGFDCNVVINTDRLQKFPLFTGSFSYILGVIATFFKKKTFLTSVVVNSDETIDGEFLLIAVGNCPYCGGGIKAIPTAAPFNGSLDVIVVKNVSHAQFISMFCDYKNGTHFDLTELGDRYKPIIEYRRCSTLEISGIERFCVDGEIHECAGVRVDVIPRALRWFNFDSEFLKLIRR